MTTRPTRRHINTTVPRDNLGPPADMGYHADSNQYTASGIYYLSAKSVVRRVAMDPGVSANRVDRKPPTFVEKNGGLSPSGKNNERHATSCEMIHIRRIPSCKLYACTTKSAARP